MARNWILTWSPPTPLTEGTSLELARAVLQRFREDGTDETPTREVSNVGTESVRMRTDWIGTDRSRIEVRRMSSRGPDDDEDTTQIAFHVVGLQDWSEVTWNAGTLADEEIRIVGEVGFAREVAHLFERVIGCKPRLEESPEAAE